MAFKGANPNGPWFYNGATGEIRNVTNPAIAQSMELMSAGTWMGFDTQADAQAVKTAWEASGKQGTFKDFGKKLGDIPSQIGDALNPLSDAAKVAALAWKGISDGTMWRSLAWIIGGVVLLLVGVALWIEGSINPVKALM